MAATLIEIAGPEKLLQLTQYGIRRQMTLPSALLALATRESAGLQRSFTTPTPHGLVTGDFVRVDGVGVDYNALYAVDSVVSATKFRVLAAASHTEAETAFTGGLGLSFKWKRLRIGVRWAVPCATDYGLGANTLAMGISVGAYPYKSGDCEFFRGSSLTGSLIRFASNGRGFFHTQDVATSCPILAKRRDTVTTRTWAGYAGNSIYGFLAAERACPALWLLEFAIAAGTVRQTNGWFTSPNSAGFTSAEFKTVLKDSTPLEAMVTSSIANVTSHTLNLTTAAWGALDFLPGDGVPKCFEFLWQDSTQPVELFDVGYAVIDE